MKLTDFTDYERQRNAVKLWAERSAIPEFRGQLKPIREHNAWVRGNEMEGRDHGGHQRCHREIRGTASAGSGQLTLHSLRRHTAATAARETGQFPA